MSRVQYCALHMCGVLRYLRVRVIGSRTDYTIQFKTGYSWVWCRAKFAILGILNSWESSLGDGHKTWAGRLIHAKISLRKKNVSVTSSPWLCSNKTFPPRPEVDIWKCVRRRRFKVNDKSWKFVPDGSSEVFNFALSILASGHQL